MPTSKRVVLRLCVTSEPTDVAPVLVSRIWKYLSFSEINEAGGATRLRYLGTKYRHDRLNLLSAS